MHMHRIRMRLFVAMGLPVVAGCGASQGASTTDPPEVVVPIDANTPPSDDPLVIAEPNNTCGVDEVKEQICGGVDKNAGCGANGKQLTSYGAHSFVLGGASYHAHSEAFEDFAPDQGATDAYRTSLAKDAPHIEDRENYCCYSKCTDVTVTPAFTQTVPPNMMATDKCIPALSSTSKPASGEPSCPAGIELSGVRLPFTHRDPQANCCYQQLVLRPPPRPYPNRGRPMRVDGESVLAETTRQSSWASTGFDDLGEVTAAQRVALHEAWLAEARLEHASVAAFAKLSLQLMALGAPPELIDAAHAAARDEIAHARLAFTIASRWGNAVVGPAPSPRWGGAIDGDVLTLLCETLEDGCVGETIAAQEASVLSSRARDPEVAAALATIAADELRHAELAWRIVVWCLPLTGAAGVRALHNLRAALIAEQTAAVRTPCCDRALEGHGVLCAHERAALRRDMVEHVIAPCLDGLIEAQNEVVNPTPLSHSPASANATMREESTW